MDYLDSTLHASILSSLAANLASSSSQDDLSLLTSTFSALLPATNGAINSVLSRLETNGNSEHLVEITGTQADGIIAFAEYATNTAPDLGNLNRVTALLTVLPTWSIESSLGLSGSKDWAAPDLIAFALSTAILKITDGGIGERTSTLRSIADFQKALVDATEVAPGWRIISHVLPALNGAKRAFLMSPFNWTTSDRIPVQSKFSERAANEIENTTSQKSGLSNLQKTLVQDTLFRYSNSSKGISSGLGELAALECQEAYFTAALLSSTRFSTEKNWDALLKQDIFAPASSREHVQQCLHQSIDSWTKSLAMLEGEEEVIADEYSFDILIKSLRVATLASVADGAVSSPVFTILERLICDISPVIDENVQSGAVECLHILVRAFPTMAIAAGTLLRKFILSSCAVFESWLSLDPSVALRSAAKAYSTCSQLSNLELSSIIPSVLNHLVISYRAGTIRPISRFGSDAQSMRSGGMRDVDQQRLVSANVAHAAAIIALESKQESLIVLAATILLQKLQGTDPLVDGVIMYELAELAKHVHVTLFSEIVKAISNVSRNAGKSEGLEQAVSIAQNKIAASGTKPEFQKIFLSELLSLFIARGVQDSSSQTRAEISSTLLDLIPLIDASTSNISELHSTFEAELVSLFRNMWYLCILSGFLSTPSRIADWQRAALIRIAENTPCLLQGVGNDFIETDLPFNSILKRTNFTLTTERAKNDLSGPIPSQASQIRTLSAAQTTFLLTILRVESLRAEGGRPSTMLSYFHKEGINAGPLSPILAVIANSVNSTFVTSFSHLVTRHSIKRSIYGEVREILLQCCHPIARVRSVSTRYLNDLISSFPSLLCEATVVNVLLELLTVLRRACQAEFTDEYTPTYKFPSARGGFSLTLPDDYSLRNTVLSELHQYAKAWLTSAIGRAPFEMSGLLQDYIDGSAPVIGLHTSMNSEEEMGKSVAIDMIRVLPSQDAAVQNSGGWKSDNSANFASTYATRNFYGGGAVTAPESARSTLMTELLSLANDIRDHKMHSTIIELRSLFYRCAGHLVQSNTPNLDILHQLVGLPVQIFTEGSLSLGQEVWTWVVDARPDLESRLMAEVSEAWTIAMGQKRGLFSDKLNRENPLDQETRFTPTDKAAMLKDYELASHLLQPHSILLSFLSSRFQAFRYRDRELVLASMRLLMRSCLAAESWSTHQLARELRMRILSFGFTILQGSQMETAVEYTFRASLYSGVLSWFAIRAGWSFGSNRIQIKADLQSIAELRAAIATDVPSYNFYATSVTASPQAILPGGVSLSTGLARHSAKRQLVLTLLENETDRLRLWLNPLMDATIGEVPSARIVSEANVRQLAQTAWKYSPSVAVHLPERFKLASFTKEITRLVRNEPERASHVPEALNFFVGESISNQIRPQLKHLLFWAPVPVVSALRFLFPKFESDPILLQYALRVLEHHPVEVTFFYIPQVVQALRTDSLGYAERFIFETSKISQLFCHQIIWNMKANAYRGDAGEEADPMKPTLDRMVEMIVSSLSGKAKDFYLREFAFFDEVTSISAKLKPFIKASKPEKKAKIDEEMALIKVDAGVYLPSNPDGEVVDIDRLSGRPLQSHAKAPFMATFKVRREKKAEIDPESLLTASETAEVSEKKPETYDTWQSAIFKVGDDCRQDVLALQIIAMHKNIFTALGLDLLVTPYRVTATGPGCGVIDVIPNATSRDEMGRAKVNDLKSFFLLKYGNVDSVEFQKARINFIQSMAAYSLLCYLIQIKDRHNGNIMIDAEGRIIHIDFGFLFDIGPGGVKFEPGSFKLTHEMVMLMGGKDSIGFKQFCSLTVKSFLACRPYGQAVVDTSSLMLAAEFPSFKGEPTMDRLRERFQLGLTEKEAAAYMMGVINNAFENPRSIVYDEFQYLQNAIPYSR